MEDLAAGPDKQHSTWLPLPEKAGSDSCWLICVVSPQTAKANAGDDKEILTNDVSAQVQESTTMVKLWTGLCLVFIFLFIFM